MVHPLEELQDALSSFVEQADHFVLLLTTHDEEIPLIVRTLDAIDGESPADVFFTDTTPLRNGKQYADDVLNHAWAQLTEVNAERQSEGKAPLADIPTSYWSSDWTPAQKLGALIRHMTQWFPPNEGNRLVVSLLPEDIQDRNAHSELLGALIPFKGYEPWMHNVRLVLRDDAAQPFAHEALDRADVESVLLYTTRVTVAAIADATAREAEDKDLPPQRRINALLQCATFDVAFGRYDAAIEKYGVLYTYYEQHQLHEMRALAVQGVGDVLSRVGRFPAAREKYMQALDIASDAKSLQLILHLTTALGDVDMQLQAFVEAAQSYGVGASAAEKVGNGLARADLLEKCGHAYVASGDVRSAAQAWTAAATVAREFAYDVRLLSVLERLRELSAQAGYHELVANYDTELREVRARLG